MASQTFYIPAAADEPGAVRRDSVRPLAGAPELLPEAEYVRPVKLGRRPPEKAAKCVKLGDHIRRLDLVPLPPSADNSAKAMASIKQMLGNDREGDCVLASTGHGEGVWSGNETGTPTLSSDQEALAEYHRICGPGDNGCVITEVLDAWTTGGIRIGGRVTKIAGYVSLDTTVPEQSKVATLVFGSHRIGFNVPGEWMTVPDGGVWDTPRSFSFVGGHDVRIVGFNEKGVLLATWGGLRTMTWAAFTNTRIVDEAYVELSPAWTSIGNLAPNGIDAGSLAADLAAWKQGKVPDWTPPSPPSPPVAYTLAASPASGPAPLAVSFTLTPPLAGGILDFGDGVRTTETPFHTYSAPGTFVAKEYSPDGKTTLATAMVTVSGTPVPPVPPTPGGDFTGTLAYVGGRLQTPAVAGADSLEAALKPLGPVAKAALLQLLLDIAQKAPQATITADLMAFLAAWASGQ